ncbi:MAG TPA: PIG-L deacetylase family protein [Tepidisphaeraceae bacterium]|jgi:LmbE family N-acetylglucosaminyl deacetylase|nr:PIG-L deacetylase family protein [Tepidisphaeraceae bacterium]
MRGQSNQRALVLSPHPDDESLGCGGTIKLITASGGQVDVIYSTSGENGFFPGDIPTPEACRRMAARRESEARQACSLLGVREVSFLHGRDRNLGSQPELYEPILDALSRKDYRSVFCPWPYDSHADHTATYGLLHEALRRCAKKLDVWLYEVWSPLRFNICLAIDSTIDAKMQALRAHESQIALLNYADAFHGLARYRSLFCPPARYAEAFFNCDSAALLNHEGIPWERVGAGV